jgi:hypothetical protein
MAAPPRNVFYEPSNIGTDERARLTGQRGCTVQGC